MHRLSPIEIRLLELAEGDLPLTRRPFDEWARVLGLEVEEVLALLEGLRRQGVIRDFRAILRHQQAGLTANAMLALAVAEEDVEAAGSDLARREWVTHCYERPDFSPFNLFAMVHACSEAELAVRLAELTTVSGADGYRVFRSVREFKKSSMKYAQYLRRRGRG
ncbi:MAG: hypothetical protein BWY87_00030 [Deltaproteobacteria bacterium ADurb.Bin510]|nr:MAG: hypothetical protein BWY87_00030 [Deltaproteobacteria bacterium ADurb.Bin510]